MQRAAQHGAGFGNRAEEGPGGEVRSSEPIFDGYGRATFQEQLGRGAFGSGFGFQQADMNEVIVKREVFHMQASDFRAATATGGPAEHQDGAVAGAAQAWVACGK